MLKSKAHPLHTSCELFSSVEPQADTESDDAYAARCEQQIIKYFRRVPSAVKQKFQHLSEVHQPQVFGPYLTCATVLTLPPFKVPFLQSPFPAPLSFLTSFLSIAFLASSIYPPSSLLPPRSSSYLAPRPFLSSVTFRPSFLHSIISFLPSFLPSRAFLLSRTQKCSVALLSKFAVFSQARRTGLLQMPALVVNFYTCLPAFTGVSQVHHPPTCLTLCCTHVHQ
jgi:hypothetical protein